MAKKIEGIEKIEGEWNIKFNNYKELKVNVWNCENVVLYEVTQQDERVRRHVDFKATNGFEIRTWSMPQIYDKGILIRGFMPEADEDVYACKCKNEKEALELIEKVKVAVKEFNHCFVEQLTPREKRYLKNFIRPFREKIRFVEKMEFKNKECLKIQLKTEQIALPYLEKGKMFSGMLSNKRYTLKELDI